MWKLFKTNDKLTSNMKCYESYFLKIVFYFLKIDHHLQCKVAWSPSINFNNDGNIGANFRFQ
jgi:hypothetical protein